MPTRRALLQGLVASAAVPRRTWAAAGKPTHLTAAMDQGGEYALYGVRAEGDLAFRISLPSRGHAAAAHPIAPEAVAFARRPGTFAIVLDCVSGDVIERLHAPPGRHFFGHGTYSADGDRLYTTENEYETGAGRIGVWSRREGYKRVGEFDAGGIGPHEMLRIPGTETLAIAIGGIRTHPDSGRQKLNLQSMQPRLVIASEHGEIQQIADVPQKLHQNSLRHIAARQDGLVLCACQWQGDVYDAPPLLATSRNGAPLEFIEFPAPILRSMKGYAGSVAISGDGQTGAVTSPRGGVLVAINLETGDVTSHRQPDICGVAEAAKGLLATDGLGYVHGVGEKLRSLGQHRLAFDNHLIAVG